MEYVTELNASYDYCYSLAKKSRSNFFYGMLLTPKSKRGAMFAVYAWMRKIDDIADDAGSEKNKIRSLLKYYQDTKRVLELDFQELINQKDLKEKHWLAFKKTVSDHAIPLRYFKDMLYGQLQTVKHQSFKTFAELYRYCYRVASTVGLICISIWGYQGGKETEKLAIYRGIALQLTNILRDVYHDAQEGHVFIPEEFFSRHKSTVVISDLTKNNTALLKALDKLIKKAAYYYKMSDSLEDFVARDSKLCLRIMTEIYFKLFNRIKHRSEIALSREPTRLNLLSKLYICLTSSVSVCLLNSRSSYE